jgi:transposase
MARKARGLSVLETAKVLMTQATTANELRICQAVIFPLEYGMTIEQTAARIGRGVAWTSRGRNAFIKAGGFVKKKKTGPGGRSAKTSRKREKMTAEEERDFIAPFLEGAKAGGKLAAADIRRALEARLGRKVALSSAYNMLHRHGWRKERGGTHGKKM